MGLCNIYKKRRKINQFFYLTNSKKGDIIIKLSGTEGTERKKRRRFGFGKSVLDKIF